MAVLLRVQMCGRCTAPVINESQAITVVKTEFKSETYQ